MIKNSGIVLYPKNLDPSYKMDQDFWDFLDEIKPLQNSPIYSRTSVARTLMARLPRLFRTRS